jgi:hypothetical protein
MRDARQVTVALHLQTYDLPRLRRAIHSWRAARLGMEDRAADELGPSSERGSNGAPGPTSRVQHVDHSVRADRADHVDGDTACTQAKRAQGNDRWAQGIRKARLALASWVVARLA